MSLFSERSADATPIGNAIRAISLRLLLSSLAILPLGLNAATLAQENTYESGAFMLEQCSTAPRGLFSGICRGRIEGFITGNGFYRFHRTESLFCVPVETSDDRRAEVYITYLKSHPGRLHLPWELLLAHALHEAWPCREGPAMYWDPRHQTIAVKPAPTL